MMFSARKFFSQKAIGWTLFTLAAMTTNGHGQETKIVGSSTVSKFANIASEKLRQRGLDVTIETTGTSGGFSLFCSSDDPFFAPITLASREIKPSEKENCETQTNDQLIGYEIGRSGVVLGYKKDRKKFALSRRDLFLALAAKIPYSDENCTLIDNPNKTWRDVRSDLPNRPIVVFGPPSTSGTRASFIDLAMKYGAREIECMQSYQNKNEEVFKMTISTIRSDGVWIDAGENDHVIVVAVKRMPGSIGILGYPQFLENNHDIEAAAIDGISPDQTTISNQAYPLSRLLRIYAKKSALMENAAADAFIKEITSKKATGQGGYLNDEGLIPVN